MIRQFLSLILRDNLILSLQKTKQMNNKLLIGGLIGGVASFLVGYLIFVLALDTTLNAHTMPGISREHPEFFHIFLGNLAFGFLLAYILTKSNTSGFSNGAKMGFIIGLLTILGHNLISFGTTKVIADITGLLIDVIAVAVLFAIVGGIVGWWLGRK